ncbi:dipicolinic acid synthetase subunit A [Oceanobacillus halotolerans]|uniref:dipicolinic acid synthetase subunit A n=1 Tax=Oceanobacillus halotolerans TaxID=2663380 RepID=UPI0013DB3651|nr:dipicolinic acid synthetase subunit A [Oceanobacillus halotolerans]
MNQHIAVIGGDARYLELIHQLQTLNDTTIYIIGFDKINQGFTGLKQVEFSDLEVDQLDAVVLPITGTDENGNVETVFSDHTIQLTEDWFSQLRKNTMIFTGIANDYLEKVSAHGNLSLIPLLDRDDVAIYNSIPTAEGTIMMAIEHTDYTIHDSRVIVTGFGRVGHTVSNKFSALGAKVSVASNSIKELARITEMGLEAIPLKDLHYYTHRCDILINTIPAHVITKKSIQHLPTHALIYDLASKPGGTDFDYAEQRGIKAILAKSLPGVVAPKTAGKIIADVIIQFMEDGKELTV